MPVFPRMVARGWGLRVLLRPGAGVEATLRGRGDTKWDIAGTRPAQSPLRSIHVPFSCFHHLPPGGPGPLRTSLLSNARPARNEPLIRVPAFGLTVRVRMGLGADK